MYMCWIKYKYNTMNYAQNVGIARGSCLLEEKRGLTDNLRLRGFLSSLSHKIAAFYPDYLI